MVSEEWEPGAGAPPRGAHPADAIGSDAGAQDRLAIPEALLPVATLDEDLRRWFERDLEDLSRGVALFTVHQPAIALFRFRSIDAASHRFWPYMEPRFLETMAGRGEAVAPQVADARARAIPGSYEMFDAWVGMLMNHLPEDATLLIVSNHGFRGIEENEDLRVDLNLLLRRLGYQTATSAGTIDWGRTSAFALEEDGSGSSRVFLNVRGREVEGSVDPAAAEGLVLDLAAALEAIASADGKRLLTAGPGGGGADPFAADLRVTQERGLGPDTLIDLGEESIPLGDLARPTGVFGVHDAAGIVLGIGRGIASGRTGWEADLLDVLPTALHLAGLPQAGNLPGKVMQDLLAEPARGSQGVASYDDLTAAPSAVMMPAPLAERGIDALRRTAHLF
jgi:predicted AlkP superfamily phosphohydrolase/phosphomutase